MELEDTKKDIYSVWRYSKRELFLGGILIFLLVFYFFGFRAPSSFGNEVLVEISSGKNLFEISENLKDENVIRSQRLFESIIIASGGERQIRAGRYLFDEPINVWRVASQMVSGDQGVPRVRVTMPEGVSLTQMASILEENLLDFDSQLFLQKAEGKHLFPDTYFFFQTIKPQEAIEVMEDVFFEKTEDLREEAEKSDKRWNDVVVMASLLEKEAASQEDMPIISGILWERLDRGMLLQVDAPFLYILGKGSSSLTIDDLKIDSPFNTYVNNGLPPYPIGAPGLDSIRHALNPEPSPYLFYLHDESGQVHYAQNHDQHVENKNRFLR